MGKKDKNSKEEEQLTRIAIVNNEKCKPSKCRQECKKSCPVVRMGVNTANHACQFPVEARVAGAVKAMH